MAFCKIAPFEVIRASLLSKLPFFLKLPTSFNISHFVIALPMKACNVSAEQSEQFEQQPFFFILWRYIFIWTCFSFHINTMKENKYADWNLFWIYLDKLFWILLGSFLFYNIGFWQHEQFSNHSKFHFLWLRQQYFGGFHLNL